MLVCFCLLSAAALAHKVNLETVWLVEFTTTDGKFSRVGVYDTRDACEAAMPAVLKEQSGYNGHRVHFDAKTMYIEGSQDPAANHKRGN